MLAQCREFVLAVETNASPMALRRIVQTFGEVPIEPTALVWYVAAVLPIADTVKAQLLEVRSAPLDRPDNGQIDSPRQRLELVCSWIKAVKCGRRAFVRS